MNRDSLAPYFAVLELAPGATLREVQNAYLRLRRLYSNQSIVLEPLEEEFSPAKRRAILRDIEEAYQRLLEAFHAEPPKAAALFPEDDAGEAAEDKPAPLAFSGLALRKIRERLNIELSEISKELKLRIELLRNLEEERYEALPEETYLKAHLKIYAQYLGLQVERVMEDYLGRYHAWKAKK
jgi:hypothetical protein